MVTTLLVIVALLQVPQIVVLTLLVPAIRDHHSHTPQHAKGRRQMTAQPEWEQVEPKGDHTPGFLIRRWIRGRYRYLRVRDERDAADRSNDYE